MDRGFSYSSRSTNVGRRRLWIATFIVIVLFAIDLVSGGAVRGAIRDGIADISLVVRRIGSNISASGFFTSKASLAAENQSLEAQVAALQEQAALSNALQAQVATLSSMTHLAATSDGVTASVASSFIASPYGTFIIGAGSDEGITTGAIVLSDDVTDAEANIAGEGVVVGTVSDVSAHTATVSEIFAPDHSVDALLDGAPISVKGSGGGNATADAPNGIPVQQGDAVTAPEFAGRVIGIVGHVDANPSNAAIAVSIGSPVNLASMQYVFVVPVSH
jgi:cell shape-determining protein MreC